MTTIDTTKKELIDRFFKHNEFVCIGKGDQENPLSKQLGIEEKDLYVKGMEFECVIHYPNQIGENPYTNYYMKLSKFKELTTKK